MQLRDFSVVDSQKLEIEKVPAIIADGEYRSFYSPKLIKLVEERFWKDLQFFNYRF